MAKNGTFLNYVSGKMIHTNTTADGKQFANISIPTDKSITGYGSFGVNMGQVLPATKKDGTVVEGYNSILLGKADGIRQVSVCVKAATKKKAAVYENVQMTNAEILAAVEANRKAYRASLKAEAPAEA